MKFERRFRVQAPLSRVVEFHRQAESLRKLTPGFCFLRFLEVPDRPLAAGDRLSFRIWLGPWPVRWVAKIEEMGENSFLDRQLAGPFRSWTHRHRFEADGPTASWVIDEIEAELDPRPWKLLPALAMWIGLPASFAYRARTTRGLLREET